MKMLHLADIHKNTKRYRDVEISLDVAEETARGEEIDLFVLAGDLYDGAEQNSEIGMHDPFAARIQRLGDIAPVAIVYGTPTHDIPGSLDILERLACRYGITILRPGQAYFLDQRQIVTEPTSTSQAILFGMPEPGRSWIASRTTEAGKAKTAEEITAELKELSAAMLLGYGVRRREFPSLPAVLVYHGQVRGCKLSNGMTLPDGQVSAEDLRQVGADYYALGDIHEPQQIKGLPAYYPGSIYTDWGEYHKAGCNLVEIAHPVDPETNELFSFDGTDVDVKVTRVHFPHPQRAKICIHFGETFLGSDIKGRIVWLEMTATKEQAAGIDTDELEALLLKSGALPGSRAILDVPPTETVRAGEIAKKATLEEKILVWGENSSIEIPDGARAKARELEAEVGSLAALSGPERRIRQIWTRLRGSRGFWARQKKDEVFIDWESYGEGVVAFIGPNGNGKTTTYEFGKPWPIPVSRPPKTLKAHFRLRDSAIENVSLEEVSGVYYRTLVNIDGANKSGEAKYFFYKGPGRDGPWEPYSAEATSGRQDPFLAAIDEVFGSMAIYMRTAFVAQKATADYPDLADATKGEKKQLIAELVGKDYSPYGAAAKLHGDTLESETIRLDATIAAAAGVDDDIARFELAIADAEERERAAAGDEERAIERGLRLKAEREAFVLLVKELDRKEQRSAQLEHELDECRAAVTKADEEVALFSTAANGRGAAETELAKSVELEKEAGALRAEKARIDEKNHAALVAYQEEQRVADLRRRSAQSDLDAARKALAEAEKAEALTLAQVDPEAEARVEAAEKEAAAAAADLDLAFIAKESADKELKELDESLEESRLQHQTTLQSQLQKARQAVSEAERALAVAQAKLESNPEPAEDCPYCGQSLPEGIYEPKLHEHHQAQDEVKRLEGLVDEADKVLKAAQKGYEDCARAFSEIQARRPALANKALAALQDAGSAQRAADAAKTSLETAKAAAQASKVAQEALAGLSAQVVDARGIVESATARLDALSLPPPPEPVPFPGAQRLAELEADLDFLDPAAARDIIRKADEADIRISEARRRKAEKQARAEELARERTEILACIHVDPSRSQLASKDDALEAEREHLTAARSAGAAAKAFGLSAKASLEDARKREAARDEASRERSVKETEIAQWRLLERAVEGVRDLELDALAPSIADVATKLLQSSGREGHIEIDTTRMSSGSAKKAKQIEDFLIFHVGQDGERQDIATCSGGEMVWIRKALYDGFAIIRARNAGIRFMTAFLDETDGALFPKDRQDYYRMLEAAHRESGRYQTILTTHSPEIQAMAAQTIDVTKLEARGAAGKESAA